MRMVLSVMFVAGLVVSPYLANAYSRLCDSAAQFASENTGVPVRTLMALTRVETGRDNDPWPWTINVSGKGYWLNDQLQAQSLAQKTVQSGQKSFDVGCFQINYRWHSRYFQSLEQMFEPEANALYAARFLKSLQSELGTWPKAIAAFHSRTPELGHRYLRRFNQISASLKQHEVNADQANQVAETTKSKGASLLHLVDTTQPAHLNSLWNSR